MPRGMPPQATSPAASIAANAVAGEFEVSLAADAPVGTYSFYLDGVAQQVDYQRNPEAAAAADLRKKEVDQIKTEADAAAQAAATAKAAADKLVTDTTAAAKTAIAAKTAADQQLANSTAAAKVADDQAAPAKAAAAANPNEASLATAAANALTTAADAAAKVKTDTANVVAAQKALDEANTVAQAAVDAKVKADTIAADAGERARLAALLKTQTDLLATNLANAAKARKINIPIVSTPVTLKITPAPITLAELKSIGPLKQGESQEVPLTIARLYDFKGVVAINAVVPQGSAGLAIPNVSIPADQSQAKLMITAAADATAGEHTIVVRATLNLNGQNLTLEQPLRIIVQQVTTK